MKVTKYSDEAIFNVCFVCSSKSGIINEEKNNLVWKVIVIVNRNIFYHENRLPKNKGNYGGHWVSFRQWNICLVIQFNSYMAILNFVVANQPIFSALHTNNLCIVRLSHNLFLWLTPFPYSELNITV